MRINKLFALAAVSVALMTTLGTAQAQEDFNQVNQNTATTSNSNTNFQGVIDGVGNALKSVTNALPKIQVKDEASKNAETEKDSLENQRSRSISNKNNTGKSTNTEIVQRIQKKANDASMTVRNNVDKKQKPAPVTTAKEKPPIVQSSSALNIQAKRANFSSQNTVVIDGVTYQKVEPTPETVSNTNPVDSLKEGFGAAAEGVKGFFNKINQDNMNKSPDITPSVNSMHGPG